MKKWDYMIRVHYMSKTRPKGSSLLADEHYYASDIWKKKDEDGKTTWDDIKEMGKEGWEMISCVPLAESSERYNGTEGFLFVFKRPLENEGGGKKGD